MKSHVKIIVDFHENDSHKINLTWNPLSKYHSHIHIIIQNSIKLHNYPSDQFLLHRFNLFCIYYQGETTYCIEILLNSFMEILETRKLHVLAVQKISFKVRSFMKKFIQFFNFVIFFVNRMACSMKIKKHLSIEYRNIFLYWIIEETLAISYTFSFFFRVHTCFVIDIIWIYFFHSLAVGANL